MPDTATRESDLPTDVAVLQGMANELLASLTAERKRVGHLEHQLDQLLKRLYGPRADKVHPDQQSLFDAPAEQVNEPPPASEPIVVTQTVKSGHGRKALPANLRRETVVVDVTEAEKIACGGEWVKIGDEVSEKLDFTPSSLFVRRVVRPKYVVRFADRPDELRIAELPPEALPKSKAAPGLVADVVVSKCVDHRVQGEAVHEMRVGLSRSGCRTRSQTAEELRRLRAVVGSVLGNGVA